MLTISRLLARTSTIFDTCNAIAEPKRRELIGALAGKESIVFDAWVRTKYLMNWQFPFAGLSVIAHLVILRRAAVRCIK